jgi:hypothetical protein
VKKENIYDLTEYTFALEVVRDHPRIIAIYNKLLPALYQYAQYQGVWPVITMVEDSKLLLEMQLDYFANIHKTKGLIKSNEKPRKK